MGLGENPVYRADGTNASERFLQRLCEHSFLSLWSYPHVFRGQRNGVQSDRQGKELCDLLVVFENHILIFSDKYCKFPNTGNLDLDWSRWFKRAVEHSVEQIWGAERWIKEHPDLIFLDKFCTQPLPIELPSPDRAIIHRIAVAHGASTRCAQLLGGSGSLMLHSDIVGKAHYKAASDGGMPFAVGQVNPQKGFVHVLDDTTLGIVLSTLDTITDFVAYLLKKERLFQKYTVFAAGEEELLGLYLSKVNKKKEHDFTVSPGLQEVAIIEGHWDYFIESPQREAQFIANKISYIWDDLIEKFNKHLLEDSQYYNSHSDVKETERLLRFLAREPRTRRRTLAQKLIDLIEKTPRKVKAARVVIPLQKNEPYYVFLLLPHLDTVLYEEYREVRLGLLQTYCMVIRLRFPQAQDIIGIATETGLGQGRSEDAIYYDAREWTEAERLEALKAQKELGLLRSPTKYKFREYEYPQISETIKKSSQRVIEKIPRNASCPCGSGKKYKHCCLKEPK